jgi:RND family efflux transporter MFP subunit
LICFLSCCTFASVSRIAPADPVINQDTKAVTVAPLEGLYIYPLRDAPARAISLNDARVSAEIDAVIKSLEVNVGDNVASAELIALLNCEEYEVSRQQTRAELDAASAKLQLAKSQYDNAEKLSAKNNISQEEFDTRRSHVAVARAEVDRIRASSEKAKIMVDHCQVRAPFSGVIIERIASTGDYAVSGTPIIRLLDNQNIEVAANVQEHDFSSLQQADELTFVTRQDSFEVQARTMLPNMDSKTRSFEVRLSFANEPAPPGATGRLQWRAKTPYISSEYLVRRGDDLGIFIMDEGIARFYAVAGAQQGRPTEVALPGPTLVILSGRHNLIDGNTVRVVQSGSH